MNNIKYCKSCEKTKDNTLNISPKATEFGRGFLVSFSPDITSCPWCNSPVEDINISSDDFFLIRKISNFDRTFLESMIELKEKDIIEFQLKINQFKTLSSQQKTEQKSSSSSLKCPKCNSTNIQLVKRKWSLLTGFLTNKVDRICINCKHKF